MKATCAGQGLLNQACLTRSRFPRKHRLERATPRSIQFKSPRRASVGKVHRSSPSLTFTPGSSPQSTGKLTVCNPHSLPFQLCRENVSIGFPGDCVTLNSAPFRSCHWPGALRTVVPQEQALVPPSTAGVGSLSSQDSVLSGALCRALASRSRRCCWGWVQML